MSDPVTSLSAGLREAQLSAQRAPTPPAGPASAARPAAWQGGDALQRAKQPFAAAPTAHTLVLLPAPTRRFTAAARQRLLQWGQTLERAVDDPSEVQITAERMKNLLTMVRSHQYDLGDVLAWLNGGEPFVLNADYRPRATNMSGSLPPLRV